jgi:hypothetical protein
MVEKGEGKLMASVYYLRRYSIYIAIYWKFTLVYFVFSFS